MFIIDELTTIEVMQDVGEFSNVQDCDKNDKEINEQLYVQMMELDIC